jgi:hypothetical protein
LAVVGRIVHDDLVAVLSQRIYREGEYGERKGGETHRVQSVVVVVVSRSEAGGAHVIIASALPAQRSLRSLHHHHIASSAYTEDKPDKPPYSHAMPNK